VQTLRYKGQKQKNQLPFDINSGNKLALIMEKSVKYCIFLSAAEPSADSHCAGLIKALRNQTDSIEFVGLGGEKMAEAGCKLIETTVGRAAMIYNAFSKVPHYYMLLRRVKKYLLKNKPDMVIVCDSPAFNFHVAKAAKRAGIKTLFYVAPQLWAWASWRIGKLRKYCDKLACILPFEEDWFRQRSIEAEYVGNPLLDELETASAKSYTEFKPATAKIALLPGSRKAEIESLWQPMQQIVVRLKERFTNLEIITVAVDKKKKTLLESPVLPDFESSYEIGSVVQIASKADFCIVASGSATLQVAAVGCPMVIMYQSSKLLWHLIGWWLVKTKHLSLVNILAGKELVPEFMPYFKSTEPITTVIEQMLSDPNKLSQISKDLIKLVEPLKTKKAGNKVAEIVLRMLDH